MPKIGNDDLRILVMCVAKGAVKMAASYDVDIAVPVKTYRDSPSVREVAIATYDTGVIKSNRIWRNITSKNILDYLFLAPSDESRAVEWMYEQYSAFEADVREDVVYGLYNHLQVDSVPDGVPIGIFNEQNWPEWQRLRGHPVWLLHAAPISQWRQFCEAIMLGVDIAGIVVTGRWWKYPETAANLYGVKPVEGTKIEGSKPSKAWKREVVLQNVISCWELGAQQAQLLRECRDIAKERVLND